MSLFPAEVPTKRAPPTLVGGALVYLPRTHRHDTRPRLEGVGDSWLGGFCLGSAQASKGGGEVRDDEVGVNVQAFVTEGLSSAYTDVAHSGAPSCCQLDRRVADDPALLEMEIVVVLGVIEDSRLGQPEDGGLLVRPLSFGMIEARIAAGHLNA
ncbi:MAG: hypothetical protein ACI9C2_001831 [Gammaproteobacteria bacterium]|jgi:hypothetical protein